MDDREDDDREDDDREDDDGERRWDVLLVGRHRDQRVADRGVSALLRYLSATAQARPISEAHVSDDGGDWTEVRLAPAAFAHALFRDGDAPETPPFREVVVGWGSARRTFEYADETAPTKARFAMEILECRFRRPTDDFVERVRTILMLRADVLHRRASDPRQDTDVPAHSEASDELRARPAVGVGAEDR